MDDLHDKLVQAYLEYFKANEAWERKQSVRKYYAVQKCVREIRDIADMRNKEIRHQHQTKKEGTDI
jgi:hypothetical protein